MQIQAPGPELRSRLNLAVVIPDGSKASIQGFVNGISVSLVKTTPPERCKSLRYFDQSKP